MPSTHTPSAAYHALQPRCYHPAYGWRGCSLHVGHAGAHDASADLTAPVPAAEVAKRHAAGYGCACGCQRAQPLAESTKGSAP